MNNENLFIEKCLFSYGCIILRNKARISTKERVECMKKLKHLYEIWSKSWKNGKVKFEKIISQVHQEVLSFAYKK